MFPLVNRNILNSEKLIPCGQGARDELPIVAAHEFAYKLNVQIIVISSVINFVLVVIR